MNYTLTLEQLDALDPCEEDGPRVRGLLQPGKAYTAAEARVAGCTFNDILWAASVMALDDREIERRLRHWMADCAAHVLHIYERDYPNVSRIRAVIEAARDYADGKIDAAAWDAARTAAWDATGEAAWGASWDATWFAARAAARDAEEEWQFDRLCVWLSDAIERGDHWKENDQ